MKARYAARRILRAAAALNPASLPRKRTPVLSACLLPKSGRAWQTAKVHVERDARGRDCTRARLVT